MAISVSDPSFLSAALEGLLSQRRRLDEQIEMVRNMLGKRGPGRRKKSETPSSSTPAQSTGPRKRRPLSDEARKRIAAAQKKRWAAFRKQG